MSDILLKSIHFPQLDARYIVGDDTLSEEGAAADAKETGDALALKADKTDTYTKEQVDDMVGDAKTELEEAIDDLEENKLAIDGYSELATVGNAEQLVATQHVTDTEPYIYRKTGGPNDVGDRVYDTIVGGSVVWNQLAPELTDTYWAANYSAGTTGTGVFSGGKFTGHLDSSTSGSLYIGITANPRRRKPQVGHKYLISATVQTINGILSIVPAGIGTLGSTGYNSYPEKTRVDYCWEGGVLNDGTTLTLTIRGYTGNGVTSEIDYTVENVNCIDLTAALGSTIADYVYSLETATAGAGVAWFKKYFPGVYYGYSEPHFEHVQTSAKCTVGFNQWDEEWELGVLDITTGEEAAATNRYRSKNFNKCFPNTTYYVKNPGTGGNVRFCFYDSDKSFVGESGFKGNDTFTTPNNAYYFRFYVSATIGATYNNDICINIHGDRDGEYEAYRKRTYPIEPKVLRGVPKLDSANRLYFNGDIYRHDGSGEYRYDLVDLGTLNYAITGSGLFTSATLTERIKPASSPSSPTEGIFCGLYPTVVGSGQHEGPQGTTPSADMTMSLNAHGTLYFNNTSYADAASFKTAMSGVYLLYERKTPEPFAAEPFQSPMVVDPLGTEEFVDYAAEQGDRDVKIPCGHTSEYPADLRGKLQHLPSLASADGRYVVVQAGNQMTLSPDTSLGLIAALEARVAALEGGNG